MRMRLLTTKLRVEIENETRVFLESIDFEIEMRVSQKSEVRKGQEFSSEKLRLACKANSLGSCKGN